MKDNSTKTTTPDGADNKSASEEPKIYSELKPCGEPVGSEIFGDIISDLQRYMKIGEEEAITGTFWVAHANIFKDFPYSPRLVITAPMKNCGKTILLSVLQSMTNHSLNGDNMTPACYFRVSHNGSVSFFLDEADMWFQKGNRNNDDMVCALNGGYEQRGHFFRTVGDSHEPKRYDTHAAVALAGIQLDRKLPDTTLDRSILIRMQRAKPGELSERFRSRTHLPIFQRHGERLLRWCNDHREQLQSHIPKIPDQVDGREFNNWESLISIAELASPEWGKKVLHILLNQTPTDADDVGIRLLRDCRRLFDRQFQDDKAIKPADLAIALGGLPDVDDDSYRTWARHHASKYREEQDARIKGRDVTALLAPFGVRKITVRLPDDHVLGFKWADIINAQVTYASMPDDYASGYVPGEDRDDGNGTWIKDYDRYSEEESRDAIPF